MKLQTGVNVNNNPLELIKGVGGRVFAAVQSGTWYNLNPLCYCHPTDKPSLTQTILTEIRTHNSMNHLLVLIMAFK